MAEKRLIGTDGSLMTGTFGSDLVSGEVLVAGAFYKVIEIDGSASVLPSGIEVNFLFKADGGETLATDDVVQFFDNKKLCDIQSWSMAFTKTEIDTTVSCDTTKVFRASKYEDISGSVEGVVIADLSDLPGGILNRFVTIVDQNGGYVISTKDGSEIYAQLFTDDTEVSGETESFYFTPIILSSFSASAGGEVAQAFSSSFRIGASDTGLVYYKMLNA